MSTEAADAVAAYLAVRRGHVPRYTVDRKIKVGLLGIFWHVEADYDASFRHHDAPDVTLPVTVRIRPADPLQLASHGEWIEVPLNELPSDVYEQIAEAIDHDAYERSYEIAGSCD